MRSCTMPWRRSVETTVSSRPSVVGGALLGREIVAALEWLLGVEMAPRILARGKPGEAALEHLEVEPVDGEDVIQRRLDRGEEARARRGELGLRELRARPQEPVIRPGVVVRLGREMVRERVVFAHRLIVEYLP